MIYRTASFGGLLAKSPFPASVHLARTEPDHPNLFPAPHVAVKQARVDRAARDRVGECCCWENRKERTGFSLRTTG